jgi:hypothetical protein
MTLFKWDEIYSVVCDYKSTRNGFKHIATLLKNGQAIYDTKVCYLNRTWERYTYESVMLVIIDKFIAQCDKQKYYEIVKGL